MEEQRTVRGEIERTGQAWREWQAVLAEVGEERMLQPGVEGGWSVKDLIAHVTWSEREMVGVLRERALVGSDLWALSNDERNQLIFEESRDHPLDRVLAEAQSVHEALVEQMKGLTDEDLNDPTRIREMVPDLPLWRLLLGNTYKHYAEHTETLRAWLEAQK